jgi:hypothetical protein
MSDKEPTPETPSDEPTGDAAPPATVEAPPAEQATVGVVL